MNTKVEALMHAFPYSVLVVPIPTQVGTNTQVTGSHVEYQYPGDTRITLVPIHMSDRYRVPVPPMIQLVSYRYSRHRWYQYPGHIGTEYLYP